MSERFHPKMRHSDIKLTMTTYVDARLLDAASAVELLPSLPLDAAPEEGPNGADFAESMSTTGSADAQGAEAAAIVQ